jgi:signal transduction histidine kinase
MKGGGDPMHERIAALAAANRHLRAEIARHVRATIVLKKRSEQCAKLLGESRVLQQDLRTLTHRLLQAQEDQRQDLSHELQDVIAQTLLGIHVKLLALKSESRGSLRSVAGNIASTQRMVRLSGSTVRKATRELGKGMTRP